MKSFKWGEVWKKLRHLFLDNYLACGGKGLRRSVLPSLYWPTQFCLSTRLRSFSATRAELAKSASRRLPNTRISLVMFLLTLHFSQTPVGHIRVRNKRSFSTHAYYLLLFIYTYLYLLLLRLIRSSALFFGVFILR